MSIRVTSQKAIDLIFLHFTGLRGNKIGLTVASERDNSRVERVREYEEKKRDPFSSLPGSTYRKKVIRVYFLAYFKEYSLGGVFP